MGRKFIYDQLVIASHNLGKIEEITELITPLGITVRNSVELQLPEPIEDGLTFIENATIKAISASNNSGLPALADDSGLSINALSGAPGIYSARWAQTANGRDFNFAMERIHNELIKILEREKRINLYKDCLKFLDTRVELDLALFKEDIWSH